jgi:hypothetical protein
MGLSPFSWQPRSDKNRGLTSFLKAFEMRFVMGQIADAQHDRPMTPNVDVMVSLRVWTETLAIARLGPDEPWPDWALRQRFVALVRTKSEVSVVCDQTAVPEDIRAERGWRALQTEGQLDLSMIGILAGLTAALAASSIPVFAISTFDSDLLLVRQDRLAEAIASLTSAGYFVVESIPEGSL